MTKARYDLYLNTAHFPYCHIADCILEERGGDLIRVGFRYRQQYLESAKAFPIDPVALPLSNNESCL